MITLPTMKKPKLGTLSFKYALNARSIKVVRRALDGAVRDFEDDETIRIRGKSLTNEGYVNAAVWYLSELDRESQARVLKTYLARLEAYLGPEEEAPAPPGENPGNSARGQVSADGAGAPKSRRGKGSA